MQFLISVLDHTPGGGADLGRGTASAAEMAAIDAFNDRLRAEGHWVFAGGLAAPGAATVIDNRHGAALFSDGPYLEAKEYIAGFWVITAPDVAAARVLAAEGSRHCNRRVELRPFLSPPG